VRELKKIVYPFILRRTKEQVAQDLPDKSENILFCEMGTKQRKVYDAFKNHYRDKLLDIIQDQGIEKSGIYILEGLLKLRQICDSPALLKGKEKHTDESVKMNELSNHVSELVGKHKILIFSQFVGMLSLIRKQLERKGVNYSYLDGQTRNRQEVVEDFQNNEEKRVFLISLKAGGVGLNLTAADYVYLVDPWWNPAVEQQAIDRTHRIGQTQKVFAYKMICKDTVEEKILKLQEKKKALVNDIISAEKSLLKSLTKDDVVDLFS
jgi:non-specific serine/threonine protein kinase